MREEKRGKKRKCNGERQDRKTGKDHERDRRWRAKRGIERWSRLGFLRTEWEREEKRGRMEGGKEGLKVSRRKEA